MDKRMTRSTWQRAACTTLAGSSDWFERGFVTYSNAAKVQQLGVDIELIDAHGAVSEAVVAAMVAGALLKSPADLAVAVTGIAGPGGAVAGKPVGTVWLALMQRGGAARAERLQLDGDRASVRAQTVVIALQRLISSRARDRRCVRAARRPAVRAGWRQQRRPHCAGR